MKGLLLLSGGLDSPVAGYLAKKNNVELIGIHFSYEPFTDNGPELKSKEVSKILGIKKLIIKNIGKEIEKISKECDYRYYFVLSKRLMMRLAEEIALKEKCDFLITGENLSQVSSQTIQNLNIITKAVNIPILRPLLCYDKIEIINLARKIGTYEASTGPEMCDVLGPKHPATSCKLNIIEKEEAKI